MLYFEQFFPKNDSDNIMLVREDKNKSAKKNILASSAETLFNSYAQADKAKSSGAKTPKVTPEKKDDFLEGFNDPYGEEKDLSHQSLAQRMVKQFASPAWQTPQTPMIKTETAKYTSPYIENFKKLYYGQKPTSSATELQKSPSANTSEDDAFREGFNDPYGEMDDLAKYATLDGVALSAATRPAWQENYTKAKENAKIAADIAKKVSHSAFDIGENAVEFSEEFRRAYGEKTEEKEKEKSGWQKGLDWTSAFLTGASLIPGWDTATNALQFFVDLGREDYPGAVLDLAGIIPFAGELADIAKYGRTGDKIYDAARTAEKTADNIRTANAAYDGIRAADDVVYGAKAVATAHDAAKTRLILSEVSEYADDVAERANLYARGVENGESLAKIFNNADNALEEMAKHAEYISKTSPVKIPDNAEVVFDVKKNGYYQMEYRYHNSDDGYFYHSRWHTKTPGAPDYQGDSWVIERRIKGVNYGKNLVKSEHVVLLSNGQMVDLEVWKKAKAIPEQFRTPAQKMMLQLGHQTPRSR